MPGLRLRPVHKFSKKLRRSILTGYSQFMSGDENGADPSYVGTDDVNTLYGDVNLSTDGGKSVQCMQVFDVSRFLVLRGREQSQR